MTVGNGIAILVVMLVHYTTWPVVSQVFPYLLPERFYHPTQFFGYFIYAMALLYPAMYLGLAINVVIMVFMRLRLF